MSKFVHALAFVLSAAVASAVAAPPALNVTIESAFDGRHLPGQLFEPDGAGPFPAVVVMHDCSGVGGSTSGAAFRWARDLQSWGIVAIVPDSFGPRGWPRGVCAVGHAPAANVSASVRALDALGALRFLQTRPEVDIRRVGVMGGSHGGWTALTAMESNVLPAGTLRFSAAVALYPPCASPYGSWHTRRAGPGNTGTVVASAGVYRPVGPVLILVGRDDDWTPASDCELLASRSRANGYHVDVHVYPHAPHSFDSDHPIRFDALRTNSARPGGHGATTGGDAVAWRDARERVRAFFQAKLAP
jgi:dienelactone hydrolase